jgi:KinB signaling pathway activation protein
LNLRKWMNLFGKTILLGAVVAAITGICMMLTDQDFPITETKGWLFNIGMMSLLGLTFGAFAHMGFFAYLMLNYIARGIFKRPYIWVSVQGFLAVVVLIEIAYWTYDTNFPTYAFWAVPLVLLGASVLIAWKKAHETTSGAWIPTLFFLVAITSIEAVPAFRTGAILSLILQIVPLFVCNAYQLLSLHKILEKKRMPVDLTNPA